MSPLYSHRPVIKALEGFAREHLGNPASPVFARQQERFLELLKIKQEEWLTPHSNEGAFGMSSAGGCMLKADLKRDGLEGVPPEGHTKATWHHGHLVECELLSFLEAIGCKLEGLQAPVRTYRADGSLLHSSAIDGLITSAPSELEIPHGTIVSCKSTAYKMAAFVKGGNQKRRGFPALPFGVMQEEPSWYLQAQLEMHGWNQALGQGFGHVLLVVQAKDVVQAYAQDEILQDSGSLAFYAELIPYNEAIAHALVKAREKADHIAALPQLGADGLRFVKLPEPGSPGGQNSKGFSIWAGPNQAATGTFNHCGACEFRFHCSGVTTGEKQ